MRNSEYVGKDLVVVDSRAFMLSLPRDTIDAVYEIHEKGLLLSCLKGPHSRSDSWHLHTSHLAPTPALPRLRATVKTGRDAECPNGMQARRRDMAGELRTSLRLACLRREFHPRLEAGPPQGMY
jgi:hypothetical protein